MKISNKVKDYMVIIGILLVVIWFISGAIFYVKSLFAEEIQENVNKFWAEEQVKTEMRYLAMRDYIENMSEEEFVETFYKDEIEIVKEK